MRERPILFSAPMVRAILDGRKTQTRLVAKAFADKPYLDGILKRYPRQNGCPYGVPGDRLWVREAHALIWPDEYAPERIEDHRVEYRADTDGKCLPGHWPDEERGNPDCPKWRPSIHMPRWASRITLRITDVRVERLNDISPDDAAAEGWPGPDGTLVNAYPNGWYAALWDHINGAGAYEANPWVWVVSFDPTQPAQPSSVNDTGSGR